VTLYSELYNNLGDIQYLFFILFYKQVVPQVFWLWTDFFV